MASGGRRCADEMQGFQVPACSAVSMLTRMPREMLPNPDTPSLAIPKKRIAVGTATLAPKRPLGTHRMCLTHYIPCAHYN